MGDGGKEDDESRRDRIKAVDRQIMKSNDMQDRKILLLLRFSWSEVKERNFSGLCYMPFLKI